MRILHVNSESGYSGGEHQVFLLVRYLRDLGVESVVVAPPGSRSEAVSQELGIEFHGQAMRNYTDLGAMGALTRLCREVGPDLVHLHTGRATWLGGIAAWRAKLPAVTTRRMDRRVRRGLRTRLIYSRFVQRAVAIAPAVADAIAQAGVPRERIEVIWDAVEPEVLRSTSDGQDLRQSLGAGEDDLVLLSMAALVHRKGLDVLIEALAQCRDQGFTPQVWIGGEGEERAGLEALARELGLGEQVRFLGWRDDGTELLAAADLFVLPSRREGVGVAALEGMGAGKAVVGSAVGGLGQAIVDGESGLLVPPGDVGALAQALLTLSLDPGLRERLGRGAVERVDQVFAARTQASAYQDLYRRVITAYGAEHGARS